MWASDIRYCPICDGYEVTDQRVAILGTRERGHGEAMFLRMYTKELTLVAVEGPHKLSAQQRGEFSGARVSLIEGLLQVRKADRRLQSLHLPILPFCISHNDFTAAD